MYIWTNKKKYNLLLYSNKLTINSCFYLLKEEYFLLLDVGCLNSSRNDNKFFIYIVYIKSHYMWETTFVYNVYGKQN